jgi:hypothetical protein
MRVWDQLRQNVGQYGWPWWKRGNAGEEASTIDPTQLRLQRSHSHASPSSSSSSSSSSPSPMNRTKELVGLCALPSEVLHQILSYLAAPSLVAVSATCHTLHQHASNDLLWASLVRENLPDSRKLNLLSNFTSYKSLYVTHYPYWFLTKHKIWFSDFLHTGKLLLARFDPRTGNIEAYRVLSEQGPHDHEFWQWDPRVSIHRFYPRVRLFLDDPVVVLDRMDPTTVYRRQGWWDGELRMSIPKESDGLFSTFFLTRSIPPQLQDPSMSLWPPRIIPAENRVRNDSHDGFQGWGHKPQKSSEISQTSFRVRSWWELRSGRNMGVRIGEEVDTYATLPPECYTPTERKPYQGIWVGDYSGHGCEFILIMQPDQEQTQRTNNAVPLRPQRLEGIKLTGDPNVPRGEHTFIAEDIGPGGLIRMAEENIFQGARIVRSRGHIAGRDFQNGKFSILISLLIEQVVSPKLDWGRSLELDAFISSQLILISHDTIAQYWEEFGHISFYERIDIDKLLKTGLG